MTDSNQRKSIAREIFFRRTIKSLLCFPSGSVLLNLNTRPYNGNTATGPAPQVMQMAMISDPGPPGRVTAAECWAARGLARGPGGV